ncbi:NERD domain-containing protein [Cephalotus follicularis]|uniref:NERD domain-containing protein n=1 Tax=Cephalotus follicularis TaxID=3775 RepID=A0A1Q3DCF0_CEPFO|nr:NERD domain-containing protein [Cephalotus follicularis]
MWVEIFCGLIIYRLCRRFFWEDDLLEIETSDTDAVFSVANRLEKLYGGKAYVGLRIPDADTGSRQNIDVVLVNKGEAVVISVKNFSGFTTINGNGSWTCEGDGRHKTVHHPDPVAEAKQKTSILESYLEQRGVPLPEGYLSYKIVIPHSKFRTIHSSYFPPEVLTHDQWVHMKPEPKCLFSGWIKGAFRGGKKELQESIQEKLNFTLSTAPMWDRLQLKGSKYVRGEFLEFKGNQEDTLSLRNIRRSKVSHLIVQKTSMFGLAHSKLQILYCARDYRTEGSSSSEWKEVTVRSSSELLFQPENSTKVRKFKLSSVVSMSLSA